MNKILNWLERHYRNVVSSIAFYPMFIVLLFTVCWLLILLVRSELGMNIKDNNVWLGLG